MYIFLVPLLVGFTCNSASAFTTFYSHRFGNQPGKIICAILRDVAGIPVWAAGYALAARATTSYLFDPSPLITILAWLLMIGGGVIIVIGLWTLRWRAAAASVQDTLASGGLYAHIRHPLYSGMFLELIGLFVWVPSMPVLIACLLGMLWISLQARLEEIDLVQRLPAYKEYMQHVPRFVPKFKRP